MSGTQTPAAAGSEAQPWLNDPVIRPAAAGGGSAEPWLNDPIVKPADTSYGSAVQEGLHDAGASLGSTLSLLSKDVGWKGGQNAGQDLSNAVSAPAGYQSATGDIAAKLKAGKLLGALADLPRAAVEGIPSLAGGLAAGAVGAAALPEAALGGAVGAGLYGAASSFGQDAAARAAANGHVTPTANDQLIAGATAAGQGALGAVGLGKTPGLAAAIAKSPAYLRALAAGTADAAGGAGANVVGQVGNTAGTTQGLTVDPSQVSAAGLQAGAARGLPLAVKQAGGAVGDAAGAAGGAVKQAATNYGTNQVLKGLPPMSDEQAASVTRINNEYDAMAPAQPDANPTQRFNGLWKAAKASLQQTIDGAIATGKVDENTGAMLQTAMQQSSVHKSALDINLLNKLNSPAVDPELATTLRNGLTDLDNVSQMVNYKQATGPFAALGAKIANGLAYGGAALAGLHGNFGEATDIGLGAMMGHSAGLTGKIGQAVGGMVDNLAGTSLPVGLLQKAAALKQAQAAGYDTSADALSPLQSTSDALRQAQVAQAQATADAAAKAKAANLSEAAANSLSGQDYKNSEAGIIARANMAVRRKDILTQAAADGRLQQPMSQDELDRVSIGLSPRDPIPANVPLNGNQPIGPLSSAPQAVPAGPQAGTTAASAAIGPQASRPGIQPVQPLGQQQAATAPLQSSQPQSGSLPVGWLNHYQGQLVANGLAPTNETVGRALGGAVASGRVSQELADHLLANPGPFLGDRSLPFQHLIAQAQQNAGMAPNPIVAPVQSPSKYATAVQTYQSLGNTLQGEAQAAGDLGLKVAIARIMSTSSGQQKADIANQELAQRSHDAVALARAKALLPPELLKGK